jgi:hypothetical protein
MKLYTEAQVRQMLFDLGSVLFNNNQNGIEEGEPATHFDYIIEDCTPIELPSDENVHLEARCYEDYNEYMDVLQSEKALSRYNGFMRGVDWMRDKIQGGNK